MATVIVFSCNQSKKQEGLKNADVLADNLKGKVEQTIDTNYKTDSKGKVGEQDSCCVVTQKYDENGYAASYISVNKAGTEKNETMYTHDDNGSCQSHYKLQKTENLFPRFQSRLIKMENIPVRRVLIQQIKWILIIVILRKMIMDSLHAFKQYKPDSTLKMSMTSTFDKQLFTGNSVKDSVRKRNLFIKNKIR